MAMVDHLCPKLKTTLELQMSQASDTVVGMTADEQKRTATNKHAHITANWGNNVLQAFLLTIIPTCLCNWKWSL